MINLFVLDDESKETIEPETQEPEPNQWQEEIKKVQEQVNELSKKSKNKKKMKLKTHKKFKN